MQDLERLAALWKVQARAYIFLDSSFYSLTSGVTLFLLLLNIIGDCSWQVGLKNTLNFAVLHFLFIAVKEKEESAKICIGDSKLDMSQKSALSDLCISCLNEIIIPTITVDKI